MGLRSNIKPLYIRYHWQTHAGWEVKNFEAAMGGRRQAAYEEELILSGIEEDYGESANNLRKYICAKERLHL